MKNNIYHEYYNPKNYPLKSYFYEEIPKNIIDIMMDINSNNLAIFRGGLGFIFLLNAKYLLKDLDMIGLISSKNKILDKLKNADIIFVNHNIKNVPLITAFWKTNQENYFKLEILLLDKLPSITNIYYGGSNIKSVNCSYIWTDRMIKISEKFLRKHNDEKTINHYKVVCKLSKFLLDHKQEIMKCDSNIVKDILPNVVKILTNLITKEDLDYFYNLQSNLLN